MASSSDGRAVDQHDWHSPGYVDEWIARDLQRDDERRKRLRQMLSYAALSGECRNRGARRRRRLWRRHRRSAARLSLRPRDLAGLFAADARPRETAAGVAMRGQVEYAAGDLREPGWVRQVGGPFDLVVSAIAIHNLRDPAVHRRVLSGDRRAGQSRWRFSRLRSVRSDRRPRPAAADHRGCRLCRGRMHLAAAAARHHPGARAARSALKPASEQPRWCIAQLRSVSRLSHGRRREKRVFD